MSGRPVRLLAAATIAAAASMISISAASAGCYGCGPAVSYAPPVVTYQAPVVYGYSYAAPCGCAAAAPAPTPMYVVNQGPAYGEPVTEEAEPTPSVSYDYGYRRAYPFYAGGGLRWHRRHWYPRAGYGYRGYGYRGYGARSYGYRGYGYRGYGFRRGGLAYRPYRAFGHRYGIRAFRPHIGPGRIHRGALPRVHGPRFAYGPRPRLDLPHRARPMSMHRMPGSVTPRGMGPHGPKHAPRGPMQKKH